MNIEDSISKEIKRLMISKPFYGLFISYLSRKIIYPSNPLSKAIPTAAVAPRGEMIGYTLYINADFWENKLRSHIAISEDEKVKTLMHECLHIIFQHPTMHTDTRFTQKNIFNIAADLVVNQYCGDIGEGHEMTFEEYNQFIEDNKEQIINGEVDIPIRSCKLEDYGFDPSTESVNQEKGTLYYYTKLMEKSKEDCPLGQMIRNQLEYRIEGIIDDGHGTWEEFEQMDDPTKQMYEKQVDHLINETISSNTRGTVPGFIRSMIKERNKPPVISWKNFFRRFMSFAQDQYLRSSRSKYNKRLPHFPGMKIRTKQKILIAIDTSGSMSNLDLEESFGEVKQIWKSGVKVDVIECDASFNEKDDMYEYNGKIPSARKGLSGGGGTSFNEPIEYYMDHKEYTCMIYITDGYAPSPTTYRNRRPLLWLLTSAGATVDKIKEQKFPGNILKMKHKT